MLRVVANASDAIHCYAVHFVDCPRRVVDLLLGLAGLPIGFALPLEILVAYERADGFFPAALQFVGLATHESVPLFTVGWGRQLADTGLSETPDDRQFPYTSTNTLESQNYYDAPRFSHHAERGFAAGRP